MKSIFYIAIITTMVCAKMPSQSSTQFATTEFTVEGDVLDHLVLDREKIKQLPQFTSSQRPIVCMSGDVKTKPKSFTGVLLKDILDLAKIKVDNKRAMNTMYVIVRSTDGYQALFSYHEIFNTPVGEQIIVFYKKDSQLLDEKEGEFGLISLNDKKNGPRYIKWLDKIIVKRYR